MDNCAICRRMNETNGSTTASARLQRLFWPLACPVVLIYLTLGVANIVRLPVFNGPDEPEHWRYVQVLRETGQMPLLPRFVLSGQEARQAEQAQHPPLYYAALAAISYVLPPLSDPRTQLALKFASLLMGLIGLIATATCARRLWPDDLPVALAATAALAWLPMFWVMTSLINNSAGSLLASGLAMWACQRVLAAPQIRARDWLWVGLIVALGMLAKITAAWLVPFVLVVIWARWRREEQRNWRTLLAMALPALVPIIILVGSWLVYNLTHFATLMPERVTDRTFLPGGLPTIFFVPLWVSKLLGWVLVVGIPLSVATPFWLLRTSVSSAIAYVLLVIYAGPSVLGLLVKGLPRRKDMLTHPSVRAGMLLACVGGGLAAWAIAIEAPLHDWNTGLYAGRYAVDAAPACALLWAAGLRYLLPWPKIRLGALVLWLTGLLVTALWNQQFMTVFFATHGS